MKKKVLCIVCRDAEKDFDKSQLCRPCLKKVWRQIEPLMKHTLENWSDNI